MAKDVGVRALHEFLVSTWSDLDAIKGQVSFVGMNDRYTREAKGYISEYVTDALDRLKRFREEYDNW